MAHSCQALSSGTVQWQQDHLRALFLGHSLLALPPASLPAGRGASRPSPAPPSWPWGLHLPCLVLKDTTTRDAAPSHCSGSSWAGSSLLSPSLPPAGPRHVDFAFWCQSLELSPPGLPSPDFQPLFPSGTGSLPGNRLPGILSRESTAQQSVAAQPEPPGSLPSSHGQLPPLPHPQDSISVAMLCISTTERPSWSPLTHCLTTPESPAVVPVS